MSDEPVGPSATRVILHVGLHQRATRVIAHGLRRASAELAEAGVRAVLPRELDPLLDVGDVAAIGDDAGRRLARHLADGSPRVLILCSGRFLARRPLGTTDIRDLARGSVRLHNVLGAFSIPSADVFVHTLRPDRLATEMQIAHLRAGGRSSFRQRRFDDVRRLSQLRLAEALRADHRVGQLWLRPFEIAAAGSHALFDDFLSTLGIDVDAVDVEAAGFPSPSTGWSTRAINLVTDLNVHLDTQVERRRVHEFVTELLPERPGRPVRAGSTAAMNTIVELHADESRRLFMTFVPDLDPETYTSQAATDGVVAHLPRRQESPTAPTVGIGRPNLHLPELVLHVGVQKTGTTLTQRSLRTLRPQLHRAGVAYVDRNDILQLPDLKAWAAYPNGDGADIGKFAMQLRAAVADRYHAVVDRTGEPPRAVLVSNESLVGVHARQAFDESPFRPLAERAISEFIEILQPDRVRLLVHVRRQDRMIESQYMHLVHGGESLTFDDYLAQVMRSTSIHYSGFIDRLAAIDGAAQLRVRPFEIIGSGPEAFVRDLLAPLEVELDFRYVSDAPTNPSYSERALQLALDLNPMLPTKLKKAKMRDFLEELIPAASNHKARLLDHDHRTSILDQYREDNELLFGRAMPEFPVDSYSTPEATDEIPRVFERLIAGAARQEPARRGTAE